MMQHVKLWIFDKDGTLISLKGWEIIMKQRLEIIEKEFGREVKEKVKPILGFKKGSFDIRTILYTTRAETSRACEEITGIDREEFLRIFAYVDEILPIEQIFSPIEGAREVVKRLKDRGMEVIVLTNDLEKRSESILKFHGIEVSRVIGADSLPYKKPEKKLAEFIIRSYKVLPEEIIMVGDSLSDIEFAKNGGFKSIGVLSGVEDRENLAKAGAGIIIKHVGEILNLIE